MKFTNLKQDTKTFFSDLDEGDYFRIGNSFYIKTDNTNEDGDNYAVDLENGFEYTFDAYTVVCKLSVKEIIYEDE